MEYILIGLLVLIILLLLVILIKVSHRSQLSGIEEADVLRIKEEVRQGNEESFDRFQHSLDRDMGHLVDQNKDLSSNVDLKLQRMNETLNTHLEAVLLKMKNDNEAQNRKNLELQGAINLNFDRIRVDNRNAFRDISERTEKLAGEVKVGMDAIRTSNEERLKQIQNVVDQKLQETLDKRIAESFKQVTENLNKLYESMGSLNTLTTDVKKMNALFSNVKSRGVWGEMQAESVLSDILSDEQWVKNYSPRSNREMVEFAIRMPGKEKEVYLPIDSKFPVSDFERYKKALESGDETSVLGELKNLRDRILSEAKDINKKYIVPPETTDFAILFVPSESLYLEIIRMEGLVEKLQDEFRVVITGPNNFAALLNSLRLGFRTMQIEQYTSTIWHLFEDMKKLFNDLSKSIDESKKHVDKAQDALDSVKKKKEKIGTVLGKIEDSAEKAAVKEIEAYYEETEPVLVP